MERKTITSKNLKSVGYDEEKEALEVEFNNGSVYQYFEVPKKVFEELMKAPSHGQYHKFNIKYKFSYARIQ